jgi:Xaa-Pro aminopeptidase
MSDPVYFCRKRYGHLKRLMQEQGLDLVYLPGGGQRLKRIADTTSGTALIVPLEGDPLLFCYSVDLNSTREESWMPVEEITTRAEANKRITDYCNQHLRDGSKMGVLWDGFSHTTYTFMKENLKGDLIDIADTLVPETFYGLYPEEIKYQRRVSRLADIACTAARENMRPGAAEYEIAAEAEYAMRREGAELTSFATIVSTGPRSAYSHGWPTGRRLKEGEFMLVDLGPQIDGYAADETRTFLLGSDPKKQRMLEAVDAAVEAVVQAVKPGAKCSDLDALSRRVLADHGFPDYPHSLGHPISGFAVPNLTKTSGYVLREGNLFTVEPGIYLPGYGGIRMEENVVVTEDGCEQLTKSPRIP